MIEWHVLRTTSTRGFRTQHDVDELWDGVMERLVDTLKSGLEVPLGSDQLIKAVEHLTAFQSALEVRQVDRFLSKLVTSPGLGVRLRHIPYQRSDVDDV